MVSASEFLEKHEEKMSPRCYKHGDVRNKFLFSTVTVIHVDMLLNYTVYIKGQE